MAAEIELGTWVFLNIVSVIGFFSYSRGHGIGLLLSFVILAGLALYSFGELDVVQTHHVPQVVANSTVYDSGGGVLTTKSVTVPEYDEKNLIITSDFNSIGWIYVLGAGTAITFFLVILVNMFRRRRVNASYYWST